MIFRVFWWIRGVDSQRAGGPWWCKDIPTKEQMGEFIDDLKPFCHRICWKEVGCLPPPDPLHVVPPEDVITVGDT